MPNTARLLGECGALSEVDEVMFARQPCQSGIDPHSDGKNFMMAGHLGLDVPEGACWIQVGSARHYWRNGKAMACNTAFTHSTWNDATNKERFVLVVRFWNPNVTAQDRAVLKGLLKATDSFLSIRVREGEAAAHNAMNEAFESWGVSGLSNVEKAEIALHEQFVLRKSTVEPYLVL